MTKITINKKEEQIIEVSFNKENKITFDFNSPQFSNDDILFFFTNLSNKITNDTFEIVDQNNNLLVDEKGDILIKEEDNQLFFILEILNKFIFNFKKEYNNGIKEFSF